MSTFGSRIQMGRGKLVGNSEVVAICFNHDVILLKNPVLVDSSVEVNTECMEHRSMFDAVPSMVVPINHTISLECRLEGGEGEFFVNPEDGFIERLLTKDITTLQMIRLVREKLEKRKI